MARWMKGVLLHTDVGVKLLCLKGNGRPWTKEECFRYCNLRQDEFDNKVRSNRLVLKASLIDATNKKGRDWYKDENNFKEVSVSIDYNRMR